MSLFKKKETHYVLVGAVTTRQPATDELTYVGMYRSSTIEIHEFSMKEEAQAWVADRIRSGSRSTFRILKETEVWKAKTVYEKTLDNTQR